MPDAAVQGVAPRLEQVGFASGATILAEGERPDRCYLIVAGEAEIVARDLIGQPVVVDVLHPGDTAGEVPFVRGRAARATTRARTDVEAYALGAADLAALEANAPELPRRLEQYADLIETEEVLREGSPFAPLSGDVLRRLAGEMSVRAVTAGTVVAREGEPADTFSLIRSGRFEVTRKGHRVEELDAGDCFGEIELETARPRVETVTALTDGELLVLAKADFDAIVRDEQAVGSEMRELARVQYGVATGQRLVLPDPVTTLMPHLTVARRARYWKLLLGGTTIFAVLSVLAAKTGLDLAVYATLIVGSLVVPVVYITFLAESDIFATRVRTLIATSLLAAVVSVPLAVIAENAAGLTPGTLDAGLVIGLVEEACKVLAVVWLLRRSSARFAMDGVIFGAAAGMGFAAFETSLFGLGQVDTVGTFLAVLWVRSLLSPFGHGTWTAIVCATIWRRKGAGRARIDLAVLGAFLLAVALHGLWDWQPLPGLLGILWALAVGIVGVLTLRTIVHRASADELRSAVALDPELLAGPASGPRITCRVCHQLSIPGTHHCVRCGAALRAPLVPVQ